MITLIPAQTVGTIALLLVLAISLAIVFESITRRRQTAQTPAAGHVLAAEETINLGGGSVEPGKGFSEETTDKALDAIALGLVSATADGTRARVQSLQGVNTYRVALTALDGDILAVTCSCPNGRANPRATCYHAAALAIVFEEAQ